MATLTFSTSIAQTLPLENSSTINNNLRDVSFSSYLNNGEVRKLAGQQDQEQHRFLGRKKVEDGEIGVFSAEKYFNGGIEEDSTPRLTNIIPRKYNQPKKDHEQDDLISRKPIVLPAGSPSIISDSSWNSQTALLQNVQRKTVLQRKTSNKANGRSSGMNFLAGLGCKCACSDKDSIDVDDAHVGEISFKRSPNASGMLQNKAITEELTKTNLDPNTPRSGSLLSEESCCQGLDKLGIGMNREKCFSFPMSDHVAGNLPNKLRLREEELNPRKSLEVFGSPVHDKKSKSFRIERRLSMLSWDTTPKMEEIAYSATSSGVVYNDNESDASSDLFEIESLTGKVTPFLARQGSDETSGCITPTTCYAPSEASIEWSVVTASAADFSVMSDYEEMRPSTTAPSPIKIFPITAKSKTSGTGKETPRRRPNILLGCNSHKAVKIAGDIYRTSDDKANFDPRLRRVSDLYVPVPKFPVENKLMGFGSRQNQRALSSTSRSLPRLHPPQSSHLLYIQ
ncbi:conserved hypothetical protein [Ricinus communis]|uniref:Phytochrome kinase substrate n=1 Tax=Ricinus communis TaxID=3988 RepID=B9S8V5_RICCO|nr:conserved hypothetical protein [Ricinus communis]